jgi:hypothetical protein
MFADGVRVGWSFFELPHDGVADQAAVGFGLAFLLRRTCGLLRRLPISNYAAGG